MTNFLRIIFFLAAVCVLGVIAGAQTPIPHVFQAGGIISAAEVNENFASLAAAIDATSGGGGTAYTAGEGLRLDGATFSLEEGQRLPQSCTDGDSAHWTGAAWECQNPVAEKFGATGVPAAGSNNYCTLGDVWLSAGSLAGAVPASGQLLPISENEALFHVIGTKYGGDGTINFALPDLDHVAPRSANGEAVHYVICTVGTFPSP